MPPYSTAHAAHAAHLAGGTLNDDSGRKHDTKRVLGLVGDRHRHAAVTGPFGLGGNELVAHGIQKVDLRDVLVDFQLRFPRRFVGFIG